MSTVTASEIDRRALMPIGIRTLSASTVLGFDLYIQSEKSGEMSLYRRRSYAFGQDDIDRLMARGVRALFISSGDSRGYRDYVRDNILKNENIPPLERYQALREATRDVFSEMLNGGDAASAVAATNELSQEMVRTVCDSKLIVNELLKAMSHDYSSFTHAMNVSTYCLLLAKGLGISDEQDLLRIGQGALLHDIGMQYVPRRILDKRGKLTDKERQVVQQHPTRGFLELRHSERPDSRSIDDGLQPSRAVRRPRLSGRFGAVGNPRIRAALRRRRCLCGIDDRSAASCRVATCECDRIHGSASGPGL